MCSVRKVVFILIITFKKIIAESLRTESLLRICKFTIAIIKICELRIQMTLMKVPLERKPQKFFFKRRTLTNFCQAKFDLFIIHCLCNYLAEDGAARLKNKNENNSI